ncbi:MAG: TetR/AcrR family transcriptional regulator [Nitrospirae bacterium]|nr:TetR/AcrR family transcriptional regulator [Nitrospirota bacterium]
MGTEAGMARRMTRAEKAAASMQAILDAALTCFNRNGYETTSMEDIAREAGVSKGLLHYHFESKEHLFLEVTSTIFRRLSERVRTTTLQLGPSVKQAIWALDELWSLVDKVRPLMPILINLGARAMTNPELKTRLTENLELHRGMLLEGLRLVLGPIRERMDTSEEDIAEVTMATLVGLCISTLFAADVSRAERGFEEFKRMVIRRVAPPDQVL